MNRAALLTGLTFCYLASLLAPLRWLWALVVNPAQALEILKGYDLLGNPLLNGRAGEYISTRAYLAARQRRRWAVILSAMLDEIEPGHCRKSYEGELARIAALRSESP